MSLVSARLGGSTKASGECDWNNGICQFAANVLGPLLRVQGGRCSIGDGDSDGQSQQQPQGDNGNTYCSAKFTIMNTINGRVDCRQPRSPDCTVKVGELGFKFAFADIESGSTDGWCKVGQDLMPIYSLIANIKPLCLVPLAVGKGTQILNNVLAPTKPLLGKIIG